MTRWALGGLLVVLLVGALAAAAARRLGRSSARASAAVSVAAGWLGAWALWTFGAGLAHEAGLLRTYDAPLFALLAPPLAYWQYRTRVTRGPEPARALFVGAQLAWLLVVLARNGLFGS